MRVKLLLLAALVLALLPSNAFAELPQISEGPLFLSLEQALSRALEVNPTLAKARARLEEGRGAISEVKSGGNPRLELQSRYSFLTPELDFTSPMGSMPLVVNNNLQASLVFEQTIATFGRLRWARQAAEFKLASLEQEFERQRQRVEYEVAVTYSGLQTARQQIGVAESALSARERFVDDLHKRERVGTSAGFDVLVAEVAQAQDEQRLVLAQQQSELALSRLQVLLGLPREQEVETLPLPLPSALELVESTRAVESALGRRAELRALDLAIEAATAKTFFEQSQDNPTLGFQTRYDQRTSTAFQTPNQWAVGLELRIPLYDGGLSRAKTSQAKAVVSQLRESRRELERQIRLEVEEALVRCRTSAQNLAVGLRTQESAQEASRLADLRFRLGVGTHQEVLDAQANARQAQHEVFEAQQGLREAHWQLEFAQGGTDFFREPNLTLRKE